MYFYNLLNRKFYKISRCFSLLLNTAERGLIVLKVFQMQRQD